MLKNVFLVFALVCANVWALAPERLRLWEGPAPYALGSEPEDVPQITVYLPPEKADGRATSAVLICPGGGYRMLCDTYEGHDLAKWLVERGVAGIVLTYRLAPKYDHRAIFADAKRAMRLVRTRAPGWRIDPARIGAIGFSAGGHLTACLATLFDDGSPASADPVERVSCRPDFIALVYPYLTMGGEYGHEHMRTHFLGKGYTPELVTRFSLDEQVTDRTPPAFVAHARTDQVVDIAHSRRFVAAMEKAGRSVEYHELASGAHGLGAGNGPEWKLWTDAFAAYLAKQDDLVAHVNPYIGCLCGNDDCGQMSAWYLFSAMGFYPFNPCGGDYVIGAPQVPRISVALPGGRTLVIRAKGLSRANKYVRSVTFNGKPVTGFILKHADLVKGGELVFEMAPAR